jgi:hypothetical protein
VQEALAAEDLVPRDRTGIFFAPRAMVETAEVGA